jgi:hypothetical protein
LDLQDTLERVRPDFLQRGDLGRRDRTPLIFDAQSIVTGHFADFVRAYTILSRSIPKSAKFFR